MKQVAEEVIQRCRELARFTEEPGRITRTFLSEPMHGVHALVSAWMREADLDVRVDGMGNIRGRNINASTGPRRFILASHLDTVPNGGAFDGILGVVLAITLVRERAAKSLPFPVEVIGFSEEEGVRFGVPFFGSRSLVGTFDKPLLGLRDAMGKTVEDLRTAFGLPPMAREEFSALGYLEFHIEQGPVLEQLGRPLGVVESIVGLNRTEVTFRGKANHAGTTPMNLRRDALTAAAEWIVAVENYATVRPGLVATNGALAVLPNAMNVIPGSVRVSLDVRHSSDEIRRKAISELLVLAQRISARRGVECESESKLDQPAVPMDRSLTDALARAVEQAGYPVHRMPSGAGHDAMIVAPFAPATMLFVRSPGGISHHPSENVFVPDVEAALQAGMALFDQLEALYG